LILPAEPLLASHAILPDTLSIFTLLIDIDAITLILRISLTLLIDTPYYMIAIS